MSVHPVDALKHFGANLSAEAESELRAICDAPVNAFLPGWYRTTKDGVSHLFHAFGAKTVEGACGHIVFAASLVVENPNNARCFTCRNKSKSGVR